MTESDEEMTQFERAVVSAIVRDEAPGYLDHLGSLVVSERQRTGVGKYVYLRDRTKRKDCTPSAATLGKSLYADIAGLEGGAGFMLYIDDGLITVLEMFSHIGAAWPEKVHSFSLRRETD